MNGSHFERRLQASSHSAPSLPSALSSGKFKIDHQSPDNPETLTVPLNARPRCEKYAPLKTPLHPSPQNKQNPFTEGMSLNCLNLPSPSLNPILTKRGADLYGKPARRERLRKALKKCLTVACIVSTDIYRADIHFATIFQAG